MLTTSIMRGMDKPLHGRDDDDEYGRFESFARKLINTPKPKPKPSADDLPPPADSALSSPLGAAGEPADDGPEREEAGRDGN
jgi:hypothetical protein